MTKKFPLTNWSEKKAFTIKLGAVKTYHIAVFADPNCPWCKRFFEENTDKLNDLEIFVYLAPVLGEDSEKLAAEILSEKDFDCEKRLSWLNRDSSSFKKGLTVTTFYLAKGLEFDQVFSIFPKEEKREIMMQAQNIAATRALHELRVYHI